jgi:dienelactone hydrolase
MAIAVHCSGCGGKFSAPDTLAGKTAKCPRCHAALAIAARVDEFDSLAPKSIIDLLDQEGFPAGAAAASLAAAQPHGRRYRPPASKFSLADRFRNIVFPSVIAFAALGILLVLCTRGGSWLAIPLAIAGGVLALYGYFAAPWVNSVQPGEPWLRPWSRAQTAGAGAGGGGAMIAIIIGRFVGAMFARSESGRFLCLVITAGVVGLTILIWLVLAFRSVFSRLLRQFGLLYVMGTVYLIAGAVILSSPSANSSIVSAFGGNPQTTSRSDDTTAPIKCASTVDFRHLPDRGTPQVVAPGVEMAEVDLEIFGSTPGWHSLLWVYTPQGRHDYHSLGCIFIAPAGAPIYAGNDLSLGDRAEHIPYVQAGYAVVALEIDGPSPGRQVRPEMMELSYSQFSAAKAGLINGKNALEYVLAKVPEVDPQRLYVAGHSSAGTFALLFAEHEPRIKGCISYAPLADLYARAPGKQVEMEALFPGIGQFSPNSHAAHLRCPLFLFHAEDDSNVPIDISRRFAEKLRATNSQVTFCTVPRGDHYDSMVQYGIPGGLQWLAKLPQERSATPTTPLADKSLATAPEPSGETAHRAAAIASKPGDVGADGQGNTPLEDPTVVPPPGPLAGIRRPDRQPMESTFRDYMVRTYANWIGGENQPIIDGMRWFAAGKRPLMAFRLGVASFDVDRPGRQSFRAADLARTVESGLVEGLAERVTSARFGRWPAPVNRTLPKVPSFTARSDEEILGEAVKQHLDGLLVIVSSSEKLGMNKMVRANLEVRLIDVTAGTKLWTSPRLNNQKAAATRGTAEDASTDLVRTVLGKLDSICSLQPMPALTGPVTKTRIANLRRMQLAPEGRLRTAMEVRYYQAKGLITAADARAAYDSLFGATFARAMDSTNMQDRIQAIEECAERQPE